MPGTCAPLVVLVNDASASSAEVFAGAAPAPGGMFTQGEWSDSAWGPVLQGSAGWIGLKLEPEAREVGWRLLVEGVVEHAEVGDREALTHVRGRYRA